MEKIKPYLIAALTAIGALIAAVLIYLNGQTPPTVPPTPEPEQPPAQTDVAFLDTWERPEFAKPEQWKANITRTLLDGQTASVILRAQDACTLVGQAGLNVMMPVAITKPSAPTYLAGAYYVGLRPITAQNCGMAMYLQLDVTATLTIRGSTVTIVRKQTKAPALPTTPIHASYDNWGVMQTFYGSNGQCGGPTWCADITKGKQGAELLKAHRITPYNIYPGGASNWAEYVTPFVVGPHVVAFGQVPYYLARIPRVTDGSAIAYIKDEPHYASDRADLDAKLTGYRDQASWLTRMVTTPLRMKDLTVGAPTYAKLINHSALARELIQIHAPVAEELCQETWRNSGERFPCREDYRAAGKKLWLYVSNMSHGADGGPVTGAPDLVPDASGGAVEVFGYLLLAIKFDLDGLLYYNTIENWHRQDLWTNPYVLGGNFDGVWLLPDMATKTALPTITVKLIREASQFADVIRAAGMVAEASALMQDTQHWDRTLSKFEALHAEAMRRLQ